MSWVSYSLNHFSDIGPEFNKSGGLHFEYAALQITPRKMVRVDKLGDFGSQFNSPNCEIR
jgi:hypothetical protein